MKSEFKLSMDPELIWEESLNKFIMYVSDNETA